MLQGRRVYRRLLLSITPSLLNYNYVIISVNKQKTNNENIKKQTIHLFTMVKYAIYFIHETLCNYIGKYIHDMIYDFCHLPSDCFTDFLSHIGCLSQAKGSNYNIVFPLKKYIQTLESLSQKNLINHMYRNLPNISRPKASDRVPFHKFIFMYEK